MTIEDYEKMGFDDEQIQIIRIGIRKGVDVSIYAKKCFSGTQMMNIYLGLKDGLDVSSYADPNKSIVEMEVIRKELLSKSKR